MMNMLFHKFIHSSVCSIMFTCVHLCLLLVCECDGLKSAIRHAASLA